jgi:hypothetical protein
MTINLSSYDTIQSNLFVRIQIDEYRTTSSAPYTSQVLRFGDSVVSTTIDGEVYSALGKLIGISQSRSELRVSSQEVTITIAGIPNVDLSEMIYSKIKGSPVRIYRLFSDAETGTALAITGNPAVRYRGFVNNWSVEEEFDPETRSSSNVIILQCASTVDVLQNKYAGRKTNPESMQKFYATDTSFDRVPTLENATFDFGAPK